MSRKKNIIPDYESVTPFLKGQASKIFKEVSIWQKNYCKEKRVFAEVSENNKGLIIQKQTNPQNVIISYERYLELKKNGADIWWN